jgi:hypothetical protein
MDIQREYQELRLTAKNANKIKFGNTQASRERLEKLLNKQSSNTTTRVTETAQDILLSKIRKLEGTLSNANFLAKVSAAVIEEKELELANLKKEYLG